MKKVTTLLALGALMLGLLQPAGAGPTQGGVTSDNVEYVAYVPFEVGTATGARVVGNYMYVTSWRSFSIYDVEDPVNPQLVSTTPYAEEVEGFRFENEDVGTNGKILIMSETTPRSILWVYDVEDKSNPVLLSQTPGFGQHTMSCLLDCKWLWGSGGLIIDLRDPTKPKDAGNWGDGMPANGGHDVEEVAPGFVLTDTQPIQLFDARNPAKPKLLALGANEDGRFIHSIRWPRKMKDRFFLAAGETNARTRCSETVGAFMTWDASNWKKTNSFQMIDEFRAQNGTGADGNPPANGLGCSSHWFQEHPKFHNGGLVAGGFYEHGTRFTQISSAGKIKEVGYFMPWAGSTSAAYWLNDEIVYAVDYSRGIDILRYTGKV